MNQYIQLLVESVFDDETNNLLSSEEVEYDSTGIISDILKKKYDDIINTTITANISKLNSLVKARDFDTIPDGYYKLNKPTKKGKLALLQKIISRLSKVFGVWKPAINLNWIDISELTTLDNLFVDITNCAFDISRWDVSNVYSMCGLFANSKVLLYTDISKWNVSNVKFADQMFRGASVSCDLSNWDFKSLISLNGMFKSIKRFDTDFSKWKIQNTGSIIEGNELFSEIETAVL